MEDDGLTEGDIEGESEGEILALGD